MAALLISGYSRTKKLGPINQVEIKMPHGGVRPGSGRPIGARTKKKRPDPVKLAAEHGLTPLGYLLTLMRDETAPPERRDWAADKAAQYCHPRLALVATQQTSPRTVNNIQIELVVPAGHDIPGKTIDADVLRIEPPQ